MGAQGVLGTDLFFLDGPGRMILAHGFQKKQQKTPPTEIERARHLRALYLEGKQ